MYKDFLGKDVFIEIAAFSGWGNPTKLNGRLIEVFENTVTLISNIN